MRPAPINLDGSPLHLDPLPSDREAWPEDALEEFQDAMRAYQDAGESRLHAMQKAEGRVQRRWAKMQVKPPEPLHLDPPAPEVCPQSNSDRPRFVKATRGKFIPHNPGLRAALSRALGERVSVVTCLLFAHLNWRFSLNGGEPFYKVLRPGRDGRDAPGGSLEVETGLEARVISRALRPILVAWPSKTAYLQAGVPGCFIGGDGRERPFCSYFDRLRKRTFYIVNQGWNERKMEEFWLS